MNDRALPRPLSFLQRPPEEGQEIQPRNYSERLIETMPRTMPGA